MFGIFNIKMLLPLAAMLVAQLGDWLKGKDSNTTGADDLFGDLLSISAPVVGGIVSGDTSTIGQGKVYKVIFTINRITGDWLQANAPAPPA